MTLPPYWWLLALSIFFQGAFFIRIGVLRIRRKEVQPVSRLVVAMLFASGTAGLVYGLVQRDPVFLFAFHLLCLAEKK